MQAQFTALASLYDSLMEEIPYDRWVDYVLKLAGRQNHTLHRVLDVGCGTGSASLLLAQRGCEVVGFDASSEMIAIAEGKLARRANPTYFVSKMEDLSGFLSSGNRSGVKAGAFDTAISLFDTVNYVTEPECLQRAFDAVFACLQPGGLFIFDMNTPYALEMELFTQNNLRSHGEPKYSWVSHYNQEKRLTTVDMTFFVKRGNTRVTVKETHHQRAYALSEIEGMLSTAGFVVREAFEAFTLRRPRASTDRAYLVAQRPTS